jgi:hypothetical protein
MWLHEKMKKIVNSNLKLNKIYKIKLNYPFVNGFSEAIASHVQSMFC